MIFTLKIPPFEIRLDSKNFTYETHVKKHSSALSVISGFETTRRNIFSYHRNCHRHRPPINSFVALFRSSVCNSLIAEQT